MIDGWDLLKDSILERLEVKASELNTASPGTIVAYDPATNRATVVSSIPRRMADGTEVQAALISQVPVVFLTSGMASGKQAALTFPLGPGDGGELIFQQRCTEDWRSGRTNAPTDGRQYSQSDCVFVPGLNAGGVVGDAENVVLRFDQTSVVLRPDNSITLGNENGSITLAEDGTITLRGTSIIVDTPARTFVLEEHLHIDTEPGLGNSGPPLP